VDVDKLGPEDGEEGVVVRFMA